jgi:integrase
LVRSGYRKRKGAKMPVYKRGDTWYYDHRFTGKRERGRIPEARTKAQAERTLVRMQEDFFNGKYNNNKGMVKLSDFIANDYLPWAKKHKRSWKEDERFCKIYENYFGDIYLRDITPKKIRRFLQDRLSTPTWFESDRSPASVNREFFILSRLLKMAVIDEILDSNPCGKVSKLEEDNDRVRYLLDDEYDRLMEALSKEGREQLKMIVLFALNTGMRRGEILSLQWSSADIVNGLIHVVNASARRCKTKGRKSRTVGINPIVMDILKELKTTGPADGLIFKSPITGCQIVEIKTAFKNAVKDAKLEDFRFHDCRHHFGTMLAMNDVDAHTIAALMGHADLKTSMRYVHIADKRKREATSKLVWSQVGHKTNQAENPTVNSYMQNVVA